MVAVYHKIKNIEKETYRRKKVIIPDKNKYLLMGYFQQTLKVFGKNLPRKRSGVLPCIFCRRILVLG